MTKTNLWEEAEMKQKLRSPEAWKRCKQAVLSKSQRSQH